MENWTQEQYQQFVSGIKSGHGGYRKKKPPIVEYRTIAEPKRLSKEESAYKSYISCGYSAFRASVQILMSRDSVPWKCKVKPEEKLCIDFADAIRKLTLEGRYKGVWGHVPNEGKRHAFTGLIMRAMGLIKGGSDYFFIWSNGGGALEAKSEDGTIQFSQKLYANWCRGSGINHGYFRTVEEGLDYLRKWGAIQ